VRWFRDFDLDYNQPMRPALPPRRTLAEVGGYIKAQKMWPLRPTFLTIFCENIYIYLISLTDWVGSEIRIMRFLCTYEMILHMSFFFLDFINLFIFAIFEMGK
jgi:hypothetical protein